MRPAREPSDMKRRRCAFAVPGRSFATERRHPRTRSRNVESGFLRPVFDLLAWLFLLYKTGWFAKIPQCTLHIMVLVLLVPTFDEALAVLGLPSFTMFENIAGVIVSSESCYVVAPVRLQPFCLTLTYTNF